MGDGSTIEWTDASWNPVTGCSKVSPGCAHCYAEALTQRFAGPWGASSLPWTPANAEANVVLHPERLDQPVRWARPRMIFVNSMSDLFHEQVPDTFIAAVWARMLVAPQHIFQVLTKRPDRALDVLQSGVFPLLLGDALERMGHDPHPWVDDDVPALANVWLGVSIENRRFVDRARLLRQVPAAVRFISAEPLLGPLLCEEVQTDDPLWADDYDGEQLCLKDIDWLIVGGESGPIHRPMRAEWVRHLRDTCLACGVAFFFQAVGRPHAEGRRPRA